MKKIFSIMLMFAFLIQSTAVVFAERELILSDTTRISSDAENCYARVTDEEFHGDDGFSLHIYTRGDYLEISQNFTNALSAGKYTLTWYGKGSGRLWYYQNWGTEWTASHVDGIAQAMPDGWTRYQKEITVDGNGDTSFLFHTDGAVDCYIDDISLVDANGINYIIDGGFEEVTVIGGENPDDGGDIPEGELILSDTTRISSDTENCYAKVTRDEFHGNNGYSLHIYTEGDYLEFGQDFTMALTAGTYTLTWYGKGSGKLWYYQNWDEWVYSQMDGISQLMPDGWTKYQKVVEVNGNGDTSFLFHTEGAVDYYIDDISLVDANGNNYIIDGGFNEVTIDSGDEPGGGDEPEEPDIPDVPVEPDVPDVPDDEDEDDEEIFRHELILSDTTVLTGADETTCYAKASQDEYRGADGYSLHFVSSGSVDFTVSQETLSPCEAGESYLLTIYAKCVNGRVWFRVGWGDEAWMVAADDGEVQPDGWKKIEKTITIGPDTTSNFFFYSDQSTEFYIDDISLVKVGTTENIIPDGSFSEVTVIEPELPDYTISDPVLKIGSEKVDFVAESGTYSVSVKVRNIKLEQGLPVELLVAVFDPSGEMVGLYSEKENIPLTDLTEERTRISVSFDAESGYTLDVYLINNRQDIDVYQVPVGF